MYNQNTHIKNNAYQLDKYSRFMEFTGAKFAYYVKGFEIDSFTLKITIEESIIKTALFQELYKLATSYAWLHLVTKEGYNRKIKTNAGHKRLSLNQIRFVFTDDLSKEFGYNQIMAKVH